MHDMGGFGQQGGFGRFGGGAQAPAQPQQPAQPAAGFGGGGRFGGAGAGQAPAQPAGFGGGGRFGNGAAPAQPAQPAQPQGSRFAGIQFRNDRAPMLGVGKFVIRSLSNEIKTHPSKRTDSFHGGVEVVDLAPGSETAVGSKCNILCQLSGEAGTYGGADMLAYVAAMSGLTRDEYDQFDPQRKFLEMVVDNKIQPGILGRLCVVTVTRGNDVVNENGQPTGDFYRRYKFEPIPEAEQDQTPSPAAGQ